VAVAVAVSVSVSVSVMVPLSVVRAHVGDASTMWLTCQ